MIGGIGNVGGGTANVAVKPGRPSVYSVLATALDRLVNIQALLAYLGDHVVGPVPREAAIGPDGLMPLEALANRVSGLAEVLEKELRTLNELLGAATGTPTNQMAGIGGR